MKFKHETLGYLEGWISILINTILFVLKLWVGLLTSSIAIIADAWHTLSDSMTSVIVIIGNKASNQPADEEHPFGHGRAEQIATIVISVVLALVGINFAIDSVNKFLQRETAIFNSAVIIIFSISLLSKEGIAQFSFWTARKTGMGFLKADGWHHRSDAIASLLILIGAFLNNYIWWIDSVLGFLVGILIIYTAFEIFKEPVRELMGKCPDPEIFKKIEALTSQIVKDDLEIHHMHIHQYGFHQEVTFHLRLCDLLSLSQAHEIVNKIEQAVRNELGIEAVIHFEPKRTIL